MKIKAIVPWFGSKRVMAPHIAAELGPHRAYWEPFCGSMAVLLAKEECSSETVNDLHGDLINLARIIRDSKWGPWLYRFLRRTLVSEQLSVEAEEGLAHEDETTCFDRGDIDGQLAAERAADFFVASWLGRNGVIGTTKGSCGKRFCVRYTKKGGHQGTRFTSAVESIPHWRRRMREVCILRRDGFDLLPRIDDAEGAAIYVDPPYLVKSAQYVHDFAAGDHARLAKELSRFKSARVVVSYYYDPRLKDLYPGWTCRQFDVAKGLAQQAQRGKTGRVSAPEVLLINGPSLVEEDLFGGK
jgi:DNA adenine methylase